MTIGESPQSGRTPMSSEKPEIIPPFAPRRRGRPFREGERRDEGPGSREQRRRSLPRPLLKGEEVELVRKAVELGKAGDVLKC